MKENQEIIQVNKEDLHELLIGFTDSHRKSQSDFWAEVKSEMKEMNEAFTKWQETQDCAITDLNTFKSETNNSFHWVRWGGSALFIIISGLGIYAYNNDIKGVKAETKEVTAIAIKEHEEKDTKTFKELVQLIKDGKR